MKVTLKTKLYNLAKRDFKLLKNLAMFLDMSPQCLQAYLNGKRKPGFYILQKFYRLGYDINDFFNNEKPTIDKIKEVGK